MSDTPAAISAAFGLMGLKVRDAQAVLATLESKYQVKASDENGYLSLQQNGTEANVGQILQAYFKQNPADFVGHVGEIRYKSDVQDTAAKVKLIRDKGLDFWNALPATPNSPTAKDVVKPTIISTELTQKQWLTLTPRERCAAITAWGANGIKNVQRIMARR